MIQRACCIQIQKKKNNNIRGDDNDHDHTKFKNKQQLHKRGDKYDHDHTNSRTTTNNNKKEKTNMIMTLPVLQRIGRLGKVGGGEVWKRSDMEQGEQGGSCMNYSIAWPPDRGRLTNGCACCCGGGGGGGREKSRKTERRMEG